MIRIECCNFLNLGGLYVLSWNRARLVIKIKIKKLYINEADAVYICIYINIKFIMFIKVQAIKKMKKTVNQGCCKLYIATRGSSRKWKIIPICAQIPLYCSEHEHFRTNSAFVRICLCTADPISATASLALMFLRVQYICN